MKKTYTEEQKKNILSVYDKIENMENIYKIRDAKQYLKDTDYIIIKIQEYKMLDKNIDNDYSEVLKRREECREILRGWEV